MTLCNYNIEQRKSRWRDLLNKNCTPQHAFIINLNYSEMNSKSEESSLNNYQLLWPENKKVRIDRILKDYEAAMERSDWLRDDYIPFLATTSGTEIFAEAFGCKVHRPDDNMPFALPLIQSSSEVSKTKIPRLEDTPLMYHFEIADELKNKAGKEALLHMVDIQSPMDIVAQIWEKSDLFVAMIEEPEAVKELVEKVRVLLFEFFDRWFIKYGNEYIAHHPDYYMDGGITLSEDEIGSVSPEMFNKFFLNELNELSDRYNGIGIHCCANSRHQWNNFKKINNLKLLNFYQPPEIINKAFEFFKDYAVQWHGYIIDGLGQGIPLSKIDTYPDNSRIVITQTAVSREEALQLSDKLWELCGRD